MGVDSYRSSALPLGMSPTWGMSTKTTSPSSWAAAQWAAVAPTLPAPTMVIFGRLIRLCSLHVAVLELDFPHARRDSSDVRELRSTRRVAGRMVRINEP